WQIRAECRPDLRRIRRGVVAGEDDALRESRVSIRHGIEPPLEREGGAVERHVDDERPPGLDVADLPPQGLLPGQPGRSPRACGERPVELELGGQIVPVLDVGPPVPRERGTHRGFHGMLYLVDDLIHDRVPIFECSYLVWLTCYSADRPGQPSRLPVRIAPHAGPARRAKQALLGRRTNTAADYPVRRPV